MYTLSLYLMKSCMLFLKIPSDGDSIAIILGFMSHFIEVKEYYPDALQFSNYAAVYLTESRLIREFLTGNWSNSCVNDCLPFANQLL